jgi:hypothetical protein
MSVHVFVCGQLQTEAAFLTPCLTIWLQEERLTSL